MCIGDVRVSSATKLASIPWSWRKGILLANPPISGGFAGKVTQLGQPSNAAGEGAAAVTETAGAGAQTASPAATPLAQAH